MALPDCLARSLAAKEITQAQHDDLVQQYQRLREKHGPLGAGAAEQAKQSLVDALKAERLHATRKARLALRNAREILTDLDAYRTADGRKDIAQAALYKLDNNGEASFDSVGRRHNVVLGMAHARVEALLDRFRRSRLLGDKLRLNHAQLGNVVREAFGENTGDAAAKGFAAAWSDTADWLRQRFNAAGGAIGKLDNWGLPQWHDARALLSRGREAWKADITPMLDLGRMEHPLTRTPIGADELGEILDGIWEGVVTNGWDSKEASRQVQGKGALANQRAEHRFLVFRDATTWLKYQADYGGGSDPFAAMMAHLNLMARDTAAMEVLGPNPGATVEWLKQMVTKEAAKKIAGKEARWAGRGDPSNRANRYNHRIDAVWGSLRGTLSTPVDSTWANIGAGIRNLITASVLGSAAPSSISDVGFQMITRGMAGLPVTGVFRQTITAAIGGATQRDAVAAGLILDNARHVMAAQARYVGTFTGPAWTAYLGDRVLALSGLTPWTQGGRHAFGLAFMHELAKVSSGTSWDELNPLLRSTFQRYGIGAEQWPIFQRAEIHIGESGLALLRPQEIAGHDRRVAERYLSMILSETEYAVPSGTHRSRTILLDQNQPGTVPGEAIRSFAQFKSFGAVFAMLHGGRVARMLIGREYGKAAVYAGALLITSSFFGALALQFKELVQGRDPRPMTSPQFWGAGLLQGGGLGIYGDFLFSDLNRYGGGIAGNIGGPTAERLGELSNLTVGNVAELIAGKDPKFAKELIQFARGNVPGGNIWYLRLAWERIVLDQLQWLADPKANQAFKEKQRRFAKDYGQQFWWQPGTSSPQRPPDLGNAVRTVDATP